MIAYASVREMSRSMSYSRYFKIATPMAAGRAASPTSGTTEPIRTPSRIEKTVTAAPLASHFSCWRRSPPARRQLSTWRATNDRPMAAIEARTRNASHVGGLASQPPS